jgi:hypothetical protein
VLFALFIPPAAVFASTVSSIPVVQFLPELSNASRIRGDLDSSIGSQDEALNTTEELKADGDGEDNINNGNSNGIDDAGDRNDNDDDSDEIGGEIVDDNVERSQRCMENAKPGDFVHCHNFLAGSTTTWISRKLTDISTNSSAFLLT